MTDPNQLCETVLRFISGQVLPDEGPGRYRYSQAVSQPTLYSSCYAVMARSLLGDLGAAERQAWATYPNTHQENDGLFRDPVIFGEGWYTGDPLWCGRAHLSCHVITALACMDSVAEKPIARLDPWLGCISVLGRGA